MVYHGNVYNHDLGALNHVNGNISKSSVPISKNMNDPKIQKAFKDVQNKAHQDHEAKKAKAAAKAEQDRRIRRAASRK